MAEVGTITQKRMPRLNQNVSGAPVPWKICAVKDESRKRGRKVKTRPKVRRTNFTADTGNISSFQFEISCDIRGEEF